MLSEIAGHAESIACGIAHLEEAYVIPICFGTVAWRTFLCSALPVKVWKEPRRDFPDSVEITQHLHMEKQHLRIFVK